MMPRGKRRLAPLQAADAEDLADEIEVLSSGVMDQRLPDVKIVCLSPILSPTTSQKARVLPPAAVCRMSVWVSAARISNW